MQIEKGIRKILNVSLEDAKPFNRKKNWIAHKDLTPLKKLF